MTGRNRIFEDAARVAGGAFDSLTGIRREAEALVRHHIDRILSGMDLVTRDEFNAVKEMATEARKENERLATRFADLEAKLGKATRKKVTRTSKTPRKSPNVEKL